LRTPFLLALFGLLWLGTVGTGAWRLLRYEATPGPASPSARWPEGSRVDPAPDRATLVMLVHPRCPCSRASLDELEALMTRCSVRLAARVLFLRPAGFPAGWERSALWRRAASIPGVLPLADPGGEEARRFHAATSGQVFLFDASGALLFRGGITGARGHTGENAAREAARSVLDRKAAAPVRTPVFGCPLFAVGERS